MMGKGILSLQEGGPNDDDASNFYRLLEEIFGDNEGTPVGGSVDAADIEGLTPGTLGHLSLEMKRARDARIDRLRTRLKEIVRTVQGQNFDAFDSDLNRPGYLDSVGEIRAGTDAAMPTWWDKVTGNRRWKSERLQQMVQWLNDIAPLEELGLSPGNLKEVFGPDSPFPERFPIDVEDLYHSNLRAIDEVGSEQMFRISQGADAGRMYQEYEEYADLLEQMRGENPIAGTVADIKEYPLADPLMEIMEEIDPLTEKPMSPHESFLSKYIDFPSMKKIMSMVPLSALAGALSPLDALEFAATPVALGSGDVPREQPRVPTVMERMSPEEEQLINRLVPATTSRALEGMVGPNTISHLPQRPRTPVLRRSFRR